MINEDRSLSSTSISQVTRLLSYLTAILSLTSLFFHVFNNHELATPTEFVLRYFRHIIQALLGWLDPYIARFASYVSSSFHFSFHITPDWKYAYLLLWLYYGAYARSYWFKGERKSSVFSFIWGGVLALLAGLATGLDLTDKLLVVNIVFWIPILSLWVFESSITVFNYYFENSAKIPFLTLYKYTSVHFILPEIVIPLSIYAIIQTFPFFSLDGKSLALFGLFIVTAVMAIYWIIRAAIRTFKSGIGMQAYLRKLSTRAGFRIGKLMTYTIIGTAIFLLLNAGLFEMELY